jgi:hypothetical protein
VGISLCGVGLGIECVWVGEVEKAWMDGSDEWCAGWDGGVEVRYLRWGRRWCG